MSADKIKKYLQESQSDDRLLESTQLGERVTEKETALDESTRAIIESGKLVAKRDPNLVKNNTDSDEIVFNIDYLDTLARPPISDVETDYTEGEIARIKEAVGEINGDMIETMEKLRIACEKEIQGELDRYVASGGRAEDFEPELIPNGIVYEAYMYDKKLKEQKRLKEERSLKNRFKKMFANSTAENKEMATADEKSTTANNSEKDDASKNENVICESGNGNNRATPNISAFENGIKITKTPNKILIGDTVFRSDDFKNYFEMDKNVASSSNRVYEKKKSDWDKQREAREEILLRNYELRQLGIPVDDDLMNDVANSAFFKICAGLLVASSVVTNDPLWSLALMSSGIIAFAGTKYAEYKGDLKYRKALDEVRNAFIDSNGTMTEADVQRILNSHKVKLPDEYALACMTKDERDDILANAKNPKELSKRKLIKHIKRELANFEIEHCGELRKNRKTIAKEHDLNTR